MKRPTAGNAVRTRLERARIARLATVDAKGRPVIVPVCFAYDGQSIYTAIDRKPKGVAPQELARVRNIMENPEVALVIDHYEEDWERLWYILVRGRAVVLQDVNDEEREHGIHLLGKKYPQYRSGLLSEGALVIRVEPWRIKEWGKVE